MAESQIPEENVNIKDMLKFINSRSILLKQALEKNNLQEIEEHLTELRRQNIRLYRRSKRDKLNDVIIIAQKISAELQSIKKNKNKPEKCLGFIGIMIDLSEKNDSEELYTEKASLYHRVFIDFFRYGKALKRFFLKNNYLFPGMKILDAGCGTGILTRVLYDVSKEKNLSKITFHGFDLTQAMLDIFREWISENKIDNIKLQQANVLQLDSLPTGWRNYDLIVSSAMLEHLPTDQVSNAIHNMGNLLKRNGTLLVFITKRNFIMRFLVQWWWKANIYKKNEIENIFHQAGFKNIQFKKFSFGHMRLWGYIIEAKK